MWRVTFGWQTNNDHIFFTNPGSNIAYCSVGNTPTKFILWLMSYYGSCHNTWQYFTLTVTSLPQPFVILAWKWQWKNKYLGTALTKLLNMTFLLQIILWFCWTQNRFPKLSTPYPMNIHLIYLASILLLVVESMWMYVMHSKSFRKDKFTCFLLQAFSGIPPFKGTYGPWLIKNVAVWLYQPKTSLAVQHVISCTWHIHWESYSNV